jgi:hypothetical protein
MTRVRVLLAALACVALGSFAANASATSRVFHPRVGNAMGLIPPVNSQGNFNTEPTENGVLNAVTYHGGGVMTGGVTVHLIFWAPAGYGFQGSPGGGIPNYEGIIEQFFSDVAHDSQTGPVGQVASGCNSASAPCNVFSTLSQYAQGTTPGTVAPGQYRISFDPTNSGDVIQDSDAYPTSDCTSPQDASACILDSSLQQEVDKIASSHGNGRGLHNLWYVFLPPDVDECISPGVCGTNAFGGYHSLMNVNGHGVTIYALTIDPLIETGGVFKGIDPNGNPDAELAADIAAHETNEAMTDPTGVGWLDANGYEVGDKCEFGPQRGTPLGFAGPDNAPYNQVINGHDYLTQEIWSNDGDAIHPVPSCVQGTQIASDPLPLPQVNLTQFGQTVTGTVYKGGAAASGVTATVALIRADADGNPVTVSQASSAPSDANGNWSVALTHPVGDDRDEITVDYSGANAPAPSHQVILTGNGGNPFTESGWTGWTDLDNGFALQSSDQSLGGHPSLTLAPCFQTGTESYSVMGKAGATSPTDYCGTASDAADFDLTLDGINSIGPSSVFAVTTNDNRAFQAADTQTPNQVGGLVRMTVPVGEPDSFNSFLNPLPGFTPTGFPVCAADLGMQTVICSGLVPGGSYTIADGSRHVSGTAAADAAAPAGPGTVTEPLTIHRGDTLTLSNGSRVLTTLHVANLQVHIAGDAATVASGKCSPIQYWGGPLTSPPTSMEAGEPSSPAGGGVAGTGEICPSSGNASGLPAGPIAQTDERSGGETLTEVADVANTSPVEGETVYGTFTALAEATDGSSPIALSITKASGGKPVFRTTNVDTAKGVTVRALPPGTYEATWTVSNPNGDTRTEMTRFVELSALQGPPRAPKPKITCRLVQHHKIKCTVSLPKSQSGKSTVRMTVASRGHLVALGHGRIRHGSATMTMRLLGRTFTGRLVVTLVVSAPHVAPVTERASARLK